MPVLISIAGNLGPGALPDSSGEETIFQQRAVIGAASRNPNITSAVEFEYGSSTSGFSSPWIWRINVTNVLVDGLDDPYINDTSSEPQYAASVQWGLEWPGGGEVQDWVSAQYPGDNRSASMPERPLCIAAYSYRAPANLTSRYSSSDNGNCSSILGDQCYASFVRNIGATCENAFGAPGRILDGCEDSWNLRFFGGGGGIDIGNSTWTIDQYNNGSALMSGDSIYHQNFRPMPESNLTSFETAQTELSVLYIGAGRGQGEPGHGPRTVMCQVANPELAATLSSASGPLRGISIISTVAASLIALMLI